MTTLFPKIIAEIGINHDGDFMKAVTMIESAAHVGVPCVKFQCHVIQDEMVEAAKDVIPANAKESIYSIMKRCAFTEAQERQLKQFTEDKEMQYLSTPFSRAAADRLERMGVTMYKIGSGECNNLPLVKHINAFGKPIILSTGMNGMDSVKRTVDCLTVPFALLHCVSMYPTPYENVHLGAIAELKQAFPGVPVGLSDHSMGIYTALAAVALGAEIVEKHFTCNRSWTGPDNIISITPPELKELVEGVEAIQLALGGKKGIQKQEQPTIDFAYASVVSTRAIPKGKKLTENNIWVKRPGGGIPAADYEKIVGCTALVDIPADVQIKWIDIYCS